MGFLDKAKAVVSKAAETAKSTADIAVKTAGDAKAKYDEHKAGKEAEAIARENEGLTLEEIIAKDEAKKVIYFPKVEYGQTVDMAGAISGSFKDQMAYGHDFAGSNVMANTNTGLTVSSLNSSERRIKYLHFTFSAINRVGDVVETKAFTQEGPIEPGGKSKFFSKDCFKSPAGLALNKVRIEYFEGDEVVIEERWIDKLVKKCTCE